MPEPDYKQLYEDQKRLTEAFKKKVKEMLEAQQAYFKSNKDFQLLKKSKALEKDVSEIITPKQSQQATIEWLAQ